MLNNDSRQFECLFYRTGGAGNLTRPLSLVTRLVIVLAVKSMVRPRRDPEPIQKLLEVAKISTADDALAHLTEDLLVELAQWLCGSAGKPTDTDA